MEQEEAEKQRLKEEAERKRKADERKRKKRTLEAAFDGDVDAMAQVLKEVMYLYSTCKCNSSYHELYLKMMMWLYCSKR